MRQRTFDSDAIRSDFSKVDRRRRRSSGVIVGTLRILRLWGEGAGAIRAVLIFCDQPWFYNLTLPRQHGAEITFASLVSLPRLSSPLPSPSFRSLNLLPSFHLSTRPLRIPPTWEDVRERVSFSSYLRHILRPTFEYFIKRNFIYIKANSIIDECSEGNVFLWHPVTDRRKGRTRD